MVCFTGRCPLICEQRGCDLGISREYAFDPQALEPVRAPQETMIVEVMHGYGGRTRIGVEIVVQSRWVPSRSCMSPFDPAAEVINCGFLPEAYPRSTVCDVHALVSQPPAVAYLLTNVLGVAHVLWRQIGSPPSLVHYALRLV